MSSLPPYTVQFLAQEVNAHFLGSGKVQIHGVNSIDAAQPGELAFIQSPRYLPYLKSTKASAVLVKAPWVNEALPLDWLVVPNPRLAFAIIAQYFEPKQTVKPGIHPTALLSEGCVIDPTATIGAYVVLGPNVSVGAHTVIHPHCHLGEGVRIGSQSVLHPRVTLYSHCTVGDRVILHSGVVLGADGFGFERGPKGWQKVPQLGRVCVGNDVEIGANSTVDRGALRDTCIGNGVKIDNQVQVGHNTRIGDKVLICGKVALAGSVTIGEHCVLGGGASVADNVTLAPGVILAGLTAVGQSIEEPGVYGSALTALPHMRWKKNMKRFAEIEAMAHRLQKLEKQLAALGGT